MLPSNPSDPSNHSSHPDSCECDDVRPLIDKIVNHPALTGHFVIALFENHEPVATCGANGSKHLARLCGVAGAVLAEAQKEIIGTAQTLRAPDKNTLASLLASILKAKKPNPNPDPSSSNE